MATAIEINPVGLGPAPNQSFPITAAFHMPFQHHEPFDQVWSRHRDEERGMGSHRLPDEHRALPRDELLEHCDDVSDEGIARQVIGKPCTRTVPPLVHE